MPKSGRKSVQIHAHQVHTNPEEGVQRPFLAIVQHVGSIVQICTVHPTLKYIRFVRTTFLVRIRVSPRTFIWITIICCGLRHDEWNEMVFTIRAYRSIACRVCHQALILALSPSYS